MVPHPQPSGIGSRRLLEEESFFFVGVATSRFPVPTVDGLIPMFIWATLIGI